MLWGQNREAGSTEAACMWLLTECCGEETMCGAASVFLAVRPGPCQCTLLFQARLQWGMHVGVYVQAPLCLTSWPAAQDAQSVNVNAAKREGGTASVPEATLPSPAGEGLPVGKGARTSCFASGPARGARWDLCHALRLSGMPVM